MRRPIALVTGAAALVAAGLAAGQAAAASVEIKDAVAQVTVIPENRSDIRVEFLTKNPRLPLQVRVGRRTVIDGGLRLNRIRGCRGSGAGVVVRVEGVGDVPMKDIPQIVLHTPRDVDVSAGGAVYGAIGRATNVNLGNAGCGDWTVANVEQELKLSQAGSGDTRAGASGSARLRVSGSGDISAAEVRGRVDVDVAGSGNVTVRSVSGPLDVHVAGSGDVTVAAGHASAMTASIAGSGNVVFHGTAETLDARIAGSGDVRAREVRGAVKKAVMGSGSVRVG
ncbi:MAG: putative filamentous hemagglutinin/adhesin [Phenylobacterium sp.]|nr:putative filamentous hemagglutinin/adhesin [Phenylobacterium sp.]